MWEAEQRKREIYGPTYVTLVLSACLQPQSGTGINIISLSLQAVSGFASERNKDQRVSGAAVQPRYFASDPSNLLISWGLKVFFKGPVR